MPRQTFTSKHPSMHHPLISVIVPVYNQEKYVKKCIHSILDQEVNDIEVVVVNDGSTDSSLSIIEDLASHDNRIKVINKDNEGVSFARRDGLLVAKGTYVFFVDSDDYLPPNALNTLYSTMLREDVDVVVGQFIRKMRFVSKKSLCPNDIVERKITRPELWDDYYISFMGVNILPVQMCGKLYKKSVIDQAMSSTTLFCDEVRSMGEDEYFNLMLHPYVNSMYICDAPVYVYRYGGVTSKYNPKLSELYNLSDIRLRLLDEYKYAKGYKTLFIEYKNYIFSDICQRIEYNNESKEQISTFLDKELEHREVFKRMKDYFNKKQANEEMAALLLQDTDKIWELANIRYKNNWKRRWIKKTVQFLFPN